MKFQIKAFSIIEIMIGIFIFSMGMVSIYMLISSTLNLNAYNKNYVIATGLAKEQLEMIRNIRDSNYIYLKKYSQINPSLEYSESSPAETFEEGKYYKLENNYSPTATFPITVSTIDNYVEGIDKISSGMQRYRLCLDSQSRFTYACDIGDNQKTHFYRYIKIEKVTYKHDGSTRIEDNAMKVISKVIWYQNGYHEFQVDNILTDWKRL